MERVFVSPPSRRGLKTARGALPPCDASSDAIPFVLDALSAPVEYSPLLAG
jgi:hypothetical protein